MEIFFQDPNEIPLPPEAVRLVDLRADPQPGGKRLKVHLEITPFQKRPSAELTLTDPAGEQVAQASILETMARKLELNLHLRYASPAGKYTLTATLYYQTPPSQGEDGSLIPPGEPIIVDRRSLSILIET